MIRAVLAGKHGTLVRRAPGWHGAADDQQLTRGGLLHPCVVTSLRRARDSSRDAWATNAELSSFQPTMLSVQRK